LLTGIHFHQASKAEQLLQTPAFQKSVVAEIEMAGPRKGHSKSGMAIAKPASILSTFLIGIARQASILHI
jgi:hypothetical protein